MDLAGLERVWMGMAIGAIQIAAAAGRSDDGARRLTRAIARGDTEAFKTLHDAWFDRALALAARLTRRDEAFCLDIVQETMIRAARKIPELATLEQVDAWMGVVVHRAALDRLRAERRRVIHEREAAAMLGAGRGAVRAPEFDPEIGERIEWVLGELSRMDERERGVLMARFGRGRSMREVGSEQGMTGGSGHGLLRRTIARLRARAREEFGDD